MSDLIMVIDDDDFTRRTVARLLEDANYEVIQAATGTEGFRLAKECQPDLVISDIFMPNTDGYEVYRLFNSDATTTFIPFILLTSLSSPRQIRKGLNAGVDDYLTKPVDPEELIHAISTRIEKSRLLQHKYSEEIENLRDHISQSLPHEIRTPLNIIKGFSELLMQNSQDLTPDKVEELAKRINQACQRLHRMSENYLFYTRLKNLALDQSSRKKLYEYPCMNTSDIIRSSAEAIGEYVDRVDDLHFNLEEAPIQLSDVYFAKAAYEIIDNAFKFSSKGNPIQIKSKRDGDCLEFRCTDHGYGIDQNHLEQLGAYMQFSRSHQEQQGVGLGLAITRSILELSQSEFKIHSTPKEGTSIFIRFKLLEPESS